MIVPEDIVPLNDSVLRDSRLREEINGMENGEVDGAAMCLFCRYTASGDSAHVQVYSHMQALHCFDFTEVVSGLSFYSQVKLINYIRWKVRIRIIYTVQPFIPCNNISLVRTPENFSL